MLRPCLPRIGGSLRIFRRSLHRMPLLEHDFSNGLADFLSPSAFDLAWTRYQGLMVEKLNRITAGTTDEDKHPKALLIEHARNPDQAALFNAASMAHNNEFFFQGLTPDPKPISEALKTELEESFSSMETLKMEFVVTASAMFGPGFIWLVKTKERERNYKILTTYLAGSPYPGAHYRAQPVDMSTEDQSISEAHRRMLRKEPVNSVGGFGPLSQPTGGQKLAPGGIDVIPILCLNTWQHLWLGDRGFGSAARPAQMEYAEKWWEVIDWAKVAAYADVRSSGPTLMT